MVFNRCFYPQVFRSRILALLKLAMFLVATVSLLNDSAMAAITTTFNFSAHPTIADQSTIQRTVTLTEGLVSFDAQLAITGNSASGGSATTGALGSSINIGNTNGSGLGIGSGSTPSIAQNQSLTFAISIVNVSGGTATFDGFTTISFSNFNLDDSARLFSGTTLLANVDFHPSSATSTSLSPFAGSSFSLFGNVNADRNGNGTLSATSFRVSSLVANFSTTAATAVPEPSMVALLSTACVGIFYRRIRSRTRSLC